MTVESLEDSWQRVVDWLETNAPVTASELHSPVRPEDIDAAQERMGVFFPEEFRAWLVLTGADNDRETTEGVLPGFGGLLSLARMERIYQLKMEIENDDPSDPDDAPFWQEHWIPIFADSDAKYGKFLDAHTGQIGSFEHADAPSFGVHDSLSALFSETADLMAQIANASAAVGTVQNGRLIYLS
ncbi:SMI1/KNR4 family protein [Streptomyces sp. NPDC058289]|uniref:SMI1/KNR4 family protein n=1 Tax=Streptomyces sp. NPDC058289 TaxID=3346425 RepID=UPI0036E19AFB